MKMTKNTFENTKDKIVGSVKAKIGDITANEALELKGKIQYAKSHIKENINTDSIGYKMEDTKEGISGKINDLLDKYDK